MLTKERGGDGLTNANIGQRREERGLENADVPDKNAIRRTKHRFVLKTSKHIRYFGQILYLLQKICHLGKEG